MIFDRQEGFRMKLKLFYSLKRKVLAVCLAGMILMALCVGGISLWTISHLTYDYEIQNMNHIVDTKATIINDELLRSENVVDYAANSVSREIKDPAKLRDPEFQQRMAEFVDNDFQNAKTDLNIICSYYRKRRKTPPFRAGDIRRVRRICVSN